MIDDEPSWEQTGLPVCSQHDNFAESNQQDLGRHYLMGGLGSNWLAEELALTRRAFEEWPAGLKASYDSLSAQNKYTMQDMEAEVSPDMTGTEDSPE